MNLGFLGPRWNITPSPPATLYLRHKLQCYKVGQSFATFFEDLTLMQIASNLISNVIIWVCTITYMATEMLRTATCLWFFVLFAFDLLCLVFALCLPTFSCVCQCIFLRANHVLNDISSKLLLTAVMQTMQRCIQLCTELLQQKDFLAVWDSEIGSDCI